MLVLYMPRLPMGGIERATVALANHWASEGRRVTVLLDRAEGELVDTLSRKVSLAVLGASRTAWALPLLVPWLRRNRPSVLHSALPHNSLVALAAGRLTPTRVTVAEHSLMADKMRLERGMARLAPLVRRLYPGAAALLTASDAIAGQLQSITGMSRSRIQVVGNPVVPDGFDAGRLVRPTDMPEDGAPVFVAVGRLASIKDFPTLLRAFRRALDQRPAHLMLLGDGPERGRLESLAAELGFRDLLGMPGSVREPWPYLAHASALVVSSRSEGFGNTVVEAMACGTPVVATRCGGPEELLQRGRLGPLVPVGDADALAAAMLAAIDHPVAPTALRQAAERFTVSAVARRYLGLLLPGEAA